MAGQRKNIGSMSQPEAATPASTGSAGTYFEQHVDAAFLALLLVRGIPPCLLDCQVEQVHLQTRQWDWHTDDLLIVGNRGDGSKRRLAAQIKRTFTISSANKDCSDTIGGAWQDFQSESRFNKSEDVLAIITLRGSERLLAHFGTLLDCAMASLDASDFFRRIGLQKYISKIARSYCQEIRTIVETNQGCPVEDRDFWEFLKSLRILSFDLNTPTRQTEAWIKNLLKQTAQGPGKSEVAAVTWDELLSLVSSGAPIAKSFTYDNLPESLRQRHSPIDESEHAAIIALKDHSEIVLAKIASTIGPAIHIKRDRLCTQLLSSLEHHQAVIITGSAGSGKSAVAKEAIDILGRDNLTFVFRAEEFDAVHLDETLQRAQIPITAFKLSSLLALHPRKLVLVESIERLLEKDEREAFTDLLQLIKKDDSWKLVLTCRDYSLDLVQTAFLEESGISSTLLIVPLLDDSELDQVISGIPKLKRPSENPALRKLFLNPYILDKAARMEWKDISGNPVDEKSFRDKVWHDIIREDHKTANAMPSRREKAFTEVALRRARALSEYADCSNLDREALDRLREGDLIVFSEKTDLLVAPAHDVLEDWALIQWLDQKFACYGSDYSSFLQEVGTHPALRRAYRKWLGEILEYGPQAADDYVISIISNNDLAQQSRDDTLVSSMLSSHAADFISRNEMKLLQNDAMLLRHVIRLLRVACRVAPDWLPPEMALSSAFVPQGSAWGAILKLIQQNLAKFNKNDVPQLLGLLEDWSQGVNWQSPYPNGAEDAAEIAFALLHENDDWNSRDIQERLLKVIMKIPKASTVRFQDLLQKAITDEGDSWSADKLGELLLEGLDGWAACRDFPALVVKLAEAKWIAKPDSEMELHSYSYGTQEIEEIFGLEEHLQFDSFPSSAYHGPFLFLLRTNPKIGMDFIINLLNNCVACYADPNRSRERFELPWQVTIELPDSTKIKQWCDERLWCIYRGSSVGPYILQSALMALESWLLELCKQNLNFIEKILIDLLKRSNNVALTAVVASIAIAYPHLTGQAAISLLTCSILFKLDRIRIVGDYHPLSEAFADLPTRHVLYDDERKESDGLKHRKLDLEKLACELQFGPYRERIWQILDNYQQDLPQLDQQTEEDKIWRLALRRMDLRQYDIGKEVKDGYVQLQLKPPEPDIQEFLAEDAPRFEAYEKQLGLLNWGISVFERKENSKPEEWSERLSQAREVHLELENMPDSIEKRMNSGGPAYVAAICVRDHWGELSQDERNWCIDLILDSVSEDADNLHELNRVSRNSMEASRPAAFILPALFGKGLPRETEERLHEGLALSLTHASEEVVKFASEGIGAFLWQNDRERALECIAALAYELKLRYELDLYEESKPYPERMDFESRNREVAAKVRSFILLKPKFNVQVLFELNLSECWEDKALQHLVLVLSQCPHEEISPNFMKLLAEAIVKWWDMDDIDWELEYFCTTLLARFVLKLDITGAIDVCKPLLDRINDHPKGVSEFLDKLIYAEDVTGSGEIFWNLWQSIANSILHATWIEHLNARESDRLKLINAIFLVSVYWKEGIRYWKYLDGYTARLDGLFEALPPTLATFSSYCHFLYQIGEKSLPDAFLIISKKLQQGNPITMLSDKNTVFYIESILRRYIYSRPAFLKSKPAIRDSVLHLLDALVESGSSSAYRMRDDFVTPISS